MPSALLRSHNSGSLPRAIRTLIGRGNNRPSLRATPSCGTSLLAGRQPYQTIFFACFPSQQRPPLSEIQELADKDRLHITDDGTVLLVRQPTPQPPPDSQRPVGRAACWLNDEPIHILRTAAHAPLGHAGLPLDSSLPPRHNAHTANARTFLLVDW